jgi:hypothetical protein
VEPISCSRHGPRSSPTNWKESSGVGPNNSGRKPRDPLLIAVLQHNADLSEKRLL